MAYNALGCIICKEGDEHNVIEVALHDTRAQRRRMPNLNDLYRFSIASLGDRVGVTGLSYAPCSLPFPRRPQAPFPSAAAPLPLSRLPPSPSAAVPPPPFSAQAEKM